MTEPVTEHEETVEESDFVDPSEFTSYDDVDSTEVDSTEGAPA